jgi:hypothetical protein
MARRHSDRDTAPNGQKVERRVAQRLIGSTGESEANRLGILDSTQTIAVAVGDSKVVGVIVSTEDLRLQVVHGDRVPTKETRAPVQGENNILVAKVTAPACGGRDSFKIAVPLAPIVVRHGLLQRRIQFR